MATARKKTSSKSVPFERSKRDVEKKGMREGSKAEMRMDSRQKRGRK